MIERQLSYIEVGFVDKGEEVIMMKNFKEIKKERTYEKSTIANTTK